MNDKNLFQITYDVFGYSPGGIPSGEYLILPLDKKCNESKFKEINLRFKNLIDDHNLKNQKAIEKNPNLKLKYVQVTGV